MADPAQVRMGDLATQRADEQIAAALAADGYVVPPMVASGAGYELTWIPFVGRERIVTVMDDDLYESEEEDPLAGTSAAYHGRLCGYPGLVWYSRVRQVKGVDLRVGDWLDTLDHRGARVICGIFAGAAVVGTNMVDVDHLRRLTGRDIDSGWLTVMFAGGETETIRADVSYDVVDPDSQVTPDGTPVTDG